MEQLELTHGCTKPGRGEEKKESCVVGCVQDGVSVQALWERVIRPLPGELGVPYWGILRSDSKLSTYRTASWSNISSLFIL